MATAPIPFAFVCPITHDVLVEPVSTADGHTYSRAAIEQWLDDHNTSPATGAVLAHRDLVPNHALRNAIIEWREMEQALRGLPPAAGGEGEVEAAAEGVAALAAQVERLSIDKVMAAVAYAARRGGSALTPYTIHISIIVVGVFASVFSAALQPVVELFCLILLFAGCVYLWCSNPALRWRGATLAKFMGAFMWPTLILGSLVTCDWAASTLAARWAALPFLASIFAGAANAARLVWTGWGTWISVASPLACLRSFFPGGGSQAQRERTRKVAAGRWMVLGVLVCGSQSLGIDIKKIK